MEDTYARISQLKVDYEYDELVQECQQELGRYQEKIIEFARGQYERYNVKETVAVVEEEKKEQVTKVVIKKKLFEGVEKEQGTSMV